MYIDSWNKIQIHTINIRLTLSSSLLKSAHWLVHRIQGEIEINNWQLIIWQVNKFRNFRLNYWGFILDLLKSMDFTEIHKDILEICRNVTKIQRFIWIFWGFIWIFWGFIRIFKIREQIWIIKTKTDLNWQLYNTWCISRNRNKYRWNNQTNTDHCCPLKRGNTQSALLLDSQILKKSQDFTI